MTKAELRSLKALRNRLDRDANRCYKLAKNMKKKAGQSHDPGGTGDEGWRYMIELSSTGDGLSIAVGSLDWFIHKHSESED